MVLGFGQSVTIGMLAVDADRYLNQRPDSSIPGVCASYVGVDNGRPETTWPWHQNEAPPLLVGPVAFNLPAPNRHDRRAQTARSRRKYHGGKRRR